MPLTLDPAESALVVVDFQERLFQAMPERERQHAQRNASTLCWLAHELDIPVLATEQYPRGLGPTVDGLDVGEATEKLVFSAAKEPAFAARLRRTARGTAVVLGMETHICVAQTCRDLLADSYRVVLATDACLSRRPLDWQLGHDRIRTDGGYPLTTEAIAFEWLGTAGTPLFKELSKRIK